MNLTDEELQIFEIAEALRLPLYEILDNMTYEEFLGWLAFLKKKPPEWREDYRAYLLLRAQGFKGKPEEVFPALLPIFRPTTEPLKDGEISFKNLRNSSMFQRLLSAKGGDNVFKDV